MIDRLKNFFDQINSEQSREPDSSSHHIAAAALLVEIMVIDGKLKSEELNAICATLKKLFGLDSEDINELIELSRKEVEDATSLYQFTKEINQHFDHGEKMALMESMWRVAFADGILDKHEENILRRVADLIHLTHSEYIRCKHAARDRD